MLKRRFSEHFELAKTILYQKTKVWEYYHDAQVGKNYPSVTLTRSLFAICVCHDERYNMHNIYTDIDICLITVYSRDHIQI